MEQRIIMKRIDQILSHPVFREQFALLQEAEKTGSSAVTRWSIFWMWRG